ncbi:Alpha/Beta hydrolase protein [Hypoxylon trugodes]|uniref:Alpha/Beta hydrolase protein n=1 Tax=Hypoxylon trugodes TaxID=326681 RepID=UPI0021948F28|nr:Alpha/Beta hydrolase protein [Hypoxylon trugodes]KAI1394476.1 Alpha/Beta hydrolase protein [Hypoxylon trugodes]
MAFVTSSPGKYLWVIGAALINLFKLPFLLCYYIPTFTRPDPRWTVFQSTMNHYMNSFIYHTAYVETVTPLDFEPRSLGDRFIRIEKAPNSVYIDVAKPDSSILPATTGGIWFPCALKATAEGGDKPVILHFHPGGYAMGDVRNDAAFAAHNLTERVGSYALFNLYRLATNPNGRFPAALQDGISAYYHLLHDLKIPAARIVISGDSAGGHIVLCMLRYIATHGKEAGLPAPSCALVWSPAIDMMVAIEPEKIVTNPNYKTDYMDETFMSWGAKRFISRDPTSSGYMNPLSAPFKCPCPLWAFCSENELFYGEISKFVEQMKSIRDNDVTFRVEPLGNHNIFFAGNLTGWKAEAERVANEAGTWVAEIQSRV